MYVQSCAYLLLLCIEYKHFKMSALIKVGREFHYYLKVVLNPSFRAHTCASGIPQTLFKISHIFLTMFKNYFKLNNCVIYQILTH